MNKELDEIYCRYAGDVYRFALRLCGDAVLAQDIVQDTMLKAAMSLERFEEKCSMKTYLCTIARNIYFNHVKRSDNCNLPINEAIEIDNGQSVEQQIFDKLQAQRIHKALHQLDEPYKEVFHLRIFAELKYGEIGALFGKTDNWARITYFRAKERIIALIEMEDNNNG